VQGETDIYHNMLAFLTKAIFSSALSLSKNASASSQGGTFFGSLAFWQ
jgi:hypothetical protein